MNKNFLVGIVGNPNVGKSTIFNALTGAKEKTANWSGVTVKKKIGYFQYQGCNLELTDLPGLYSLGIAGHTSNDQKITINYLKKNEFNFIINVIDISNLKKSLYLTLQLIERRIPLILVLNMKDVAKKKGVFVNINEISQLLESPTVSINANNDSDIKILKEFLMSNLLVKSTLNIFDHYPKSIRKYHGIIKSYLKENLIFTSPTEIISMMESNLTIKNKDVYNFLKKTAKILNQDLRHSLAFLLVNSRYEFIKKRTKNLFFPEKKINKSITNIIDSLVLNKFLSIPILVTSIYFMFVFSIKLGSMLEDTLSLLIEGILIDIPLCILFKLQMYQDDWIKTGIIAIGEATKTIASFVPIITIIHLFLAFLEGSGYMSRSAVISNKIMKLVGLSGRSFLPIIVGLGCNVPAITGTRILSSDNERFVTVMMIPFISCTARLGVYTLFCHIFFPYNSQNVIFFLYTTSIVLSLFTGLLVRNSVQKTEQLNVMELPDYKVPKLKTIMNYSFIKTKSFILGAGKTIFLVFLVVHLVSSIKVIVKSADETSKAESVVNYLGKSTIKLLKPMGLCEDDWPMAVSLASGILAKEVVVGSIISLYSSQDEHIAPHIYEKISDIREKYKKAFTKKYHDIKSVFTKDFFIFEGQSGFSHEKIRVNSRIKENISKSFKDKLAVLSYLIFVLTYFPCVSVFGVISNEIGKKWAIISAIWSTSLAYSVSIIFYQTASYILYFDTNYYYLGIGWIILIFTAFLLRQTSMRHHKSISL